MHCQLYLIQNTMALYPHASAGSIAPGAGGRLPSALWGRIVLYSRRHLSISTSAYRSFRMICSVVNRFLLLMDLTSVWGRNRESTNLGPVPFRGGSGRSSSS